MDIFSAIAAPIGNVTGTPSNSYGGLFNAPSVNTNLAPAQKVPAVAPMPATSPLSMLSQPIKSVVPISPPKPANTPAPAPSLKTSSPLGSLSAPISSVVPEFKLNTNPLSSNESSATDGSTPAESSGTDPFKSTYDFFFKQQPVTLQPAFSKPSEALTTTGTKSEEALYNLFNRTPEFFAGLGVKATAGFTQSQTMPTPFGLDAGRFSGAGGQEGEKTLDTYGQDYLNQWALADVNSGIDPKKTVNVNDPKSFLHGTLSAFTNIILPSLGLVDAGVGANKTAQRLLDATGYDKPLNDALARLGMKPQTFSWDEWKAKTEAAAQNIAKTQDTAQASKLLKDYQTIADRLTNGTKVAKGGLKVLQDVTKQFIEPLGKVADTFDTSGAAGRTLPGYRAENPSMVPAGLSTERVEPVGFGDTENTSKTEVSASTPQEAPGNLPNDSRMTPEFKGFNDITTHILNNLEGKTTVSKQFISDLTNKPELKQTERDLIRKTLADYPDGSQVPVKDFADKVHSELLPLERTPLINSKYESISLPSKQQGPVADYKEHIYESPIKTSAGNVHFPAYSETSRRAGTDSSSNYFGHTRAEDLPDAKTRRVIEVQSDLYQKGRLERESGDRMINADLEGHFTPEEMKKYRALSSEKSNLKLRKESDSSNNRIDEINKELKPLLEKEVAIRAARNADVKKLEQYVNPTAHFRMVREEVKQAAKDGKTKLQFPTGETAMKIEGLGETDNWYHNPSGKSAISGGGMEAVKPTDLKVGMEIENGDDFDGENAWIVTDVLGDGKFKAVPKQVSTSAVGMEADGAKGVSGMVDFDKFSKEQQTKIANALAETFDISGKVDTNNPIYKFYEKDLGRYLKNTYGAEPITDKQGVSWYEVPIKSEYADKPITAFKKGGAFEGNTTVEEAQKIIDKLFKPGELHLVFDEGLDKKVGALGRYTFAGKGKFGQNLKPMITLLEKNGLVDDKVLYHEAFHAHFNMYLSEAERSAAIAKVENGILTSAHKLKVGYPSHQRAEEWLADDFADYVKSKSAGEKPTSPFSNLWEKLLSKVRDLIRRVHKFKDLYDEILHDSDKTRVETEHATISRSKLAEGEDKSSLKPAEEAKSVAKVNQLYSMLDRTERSLQAAEANPEAHAKAYGEDRRPMYKSKIADLKARIKQAMPVAAKNVPNEELPPDFLSPEITEANHGVIPPLGRNGVLRPPEINFGAAKDRSTLGLVRDTMERNIEKVFPKEDAKKLNDFLVEPVRRNDLEKVKFTNNLRRSIGAKMKELGIKQNTDTDALIQVFGEGRMTLEDLKRASPAKWQQIQSASDYFRKLYDHLIDEWNIRRDKYGYSPVNKRPNYFRHFDDINEWTHQFGLMEKESLLPTELAGKTANFKPGKPFSTAEMHRTGDRTKFSAIRGMDNYLESVGRQMFHIDSVQRGRTLTKYIDQVAVASKNTINKETGDIGPLKLPNFAANVGEWTNLVSGKAAQLDRALESTIGRPVIRFLAKIKDSFGRNVINGSISSAISHSIPISFNLATVEKVPAIRGMLDTLVAPLKEEGALTTIDGQESSFLVRRFPEQRIQSTIFNKASDTLGFIFKTVDQFISRLAVASKYYEGKAHGLTPEASMKAADNYAQRVIGDRSIGNLPNIMNTRTLGFITQFQVEINDNLQVLVHDIPRWSEGKKSKIVSKLVQFMIFSFMFNLLYKKIKGSGKGLDPISTGLDIMGLSDETKDTPLGSRLKTAGSNVLGELPFSSLATGDFPLKSALAPVGTFIKDIASGNLDDAKTQGTKTAAEFLSPIGGGAQALKTYQGIESVKSGQTTTMNGKTKATVEQTPGNYVKAALFGPTALNADANTKANDLYNRIAGQKQGSADLTKQAEDLDTELQGMAKADANAKVADLATKNPELFAKLKTVVEERKQGLTQEERLMKQLGVANGERARYVDEAIMKLPDSASRNAYLKDLVSKKIVSPTVLEQIKTIHTSGGSLPVVPNGTTASKSSIIDRVATYAKAIGVDPLTAFNRIFTGQSIKDVRNGAVIVDRMSYADSSAESKKQLNATTTPGLTGADVRLDHTVPLEIGGSNATSNLRLVTKAEWESYTPVEDFLGKALEEGKVSKKDAQDLITRFKKGEITADEVRASKAISTNE